MWWGGEAGSPERENDWSKVIQQPPAWMSSGILVPHLVLPADVVSTQGDFGMGASGWFIILGGEAPSASLGKDFLPADVVG